MIRDDHCHRARPVFREDGNYLFASYKRDDGREVAEFLDQLVSRGVNIWYDQELDGGQDYGSIIDKRIEGSCGVLLFLSKRVIHQPEGATDWVYSETKTAKRLGRRIYPLLLDGATLSTRWLAEVGNLHTLDVRAPEVLGKVLKIARELNAVAPSSAHAGSPSDANMNKANYWPVLFLATLIVAGFLFVDRQNLARQVGDLGGGRGDFESEAVGGGDQSVRRVPGDGSHGPERSSPARYGAGSASRPALPSAVVPDEYKKSIENETRKWTYSDGALRFNGEAVMHWEQCAGVLSMAEKNRRFVEGKLSAVPGVLKTPTVKLCFYCYGIAMDRERNSGIQPVR